MTWDAEGKLIPPGNLFFPPEFQNPHPDLFSWADVPVEGNCSDTGLCGLSSDFLAGAAAECGGWRDVALEGPGAPNGVGPPGMTWILVGAVGLDGGRADAEGEGWTGGGGGLFFS